MSTKGNDNFHLSEKCVSYKIWFYITIINHSSLFAILVAVLCVMKRLKFYRRLNWFSSINFCIYLCLPHNIYIFWPFWSYKGVAGIYGLAYISYIYLCCLRSQTKYMLFIRLYCVSSILAWNILVKESRTSIHNGDSKSEKVDLNERLGAINDCEIFG